MARARRLDRPADSPYPPGKKVQFQFEGRPMDGLAGEPLAISLLAGGVRVFGRSIKYHRPRSPFCLHGHCSGCLVRVDGLPNVRACRTALQAGMQVERQLGWPGAGRDMFRMLDWVYGERMDHHSLLTSSGTLARMAMGFVRRMAGFGHPPTAEPRPPTPKRRVSVPAVVIGAGVAGLHAAVELGQAGHRVVVLESEDLPGGRLCDAGCRLAGATGWAARRELLARLSGLPGVELRTGTPALAVYGDQAVLQVLAAGPEETLALEPQRLVMATGAYAPLPQFEDNDLPGVLTPRALDRLVCGHGVLPGEPVLLAGDGEETLGLAAALAELGVVLAGLVTDRPEAELPAALRTAKVPRVAGHRILRVRGGRWVQRVELAPTGKDTPDLVLDCGVVAAEAPAAPAFELAHHAGCRVVFRSAQGHLVQTDADGHTSHGQVLAAGHCAGAGSAVAARLQGQRAGLACALGLKDDPGLRARLAALQV
jgi:sarcosine oxidase, subunit alpha